MIERLTRAQFEQIELFHVRMNFSDSAAEVTRLQLKKLWRLPKLILQVFLAQARHGCQVLYYPPAGPNRLPMYRDIAVLISCRWLFKNTVLHFHAGGLSELKPQLGTWEHWLFERAYGGVDCALVLSERNPPDGQKLGARRTFVVPYGIPDDAARHRRERPVDARVRLLCVGSLQESKGIVHLIEAASLLRDRRLDFELELVGAFRSEQFRTRVATLVHQHGLADHVKFRGTLVGTAKWQAFADADVLCFPTFYEAETFGLVALEAMSFGLPVVATDWRGVASLVEHDRTGLLVPPRDSQALALALANLVAEPQRRRALGVAARSVYEHRYTLRHWTRNMERALLSVAQAADESETPRLA